MYIVMNGERIAYRGREGGVPAWVSMKDGVVFHNGIDAPGIGYGAMSGVKTSATSPTSSNSKSEKPPPSPGWRQIWATVKSSTRRLFGLSERSGLLRLRRAQ